MAQFHLGDSRTASEREDRKQRSCCMLEKRAYGLYLDVGGSPPRLFENLEIGIIPKQQGCRAGLLEASLGDLLLAAPGTAAADLRPAPAPRRPQHARSRRARAPVEGRHEESKHPTDCAPLPGLGTCCRERSRGAAAMRGHGKRRRAERSCGSSGAAAGGIAGSAAGRPVARSARLRRRGPSPCARAALPTTRPLPLRARSSGGQAMRRSKHLTDCAPLPGLDACRQQLPRCMLMSVILHPCHDMCHLPRIRQPSPQPFTSCSAPAFAFSCPTWPPVRIADCHLAWSSTMRGGAADAMHCAWQALMCSRALGPLPYGGHVATRSTLLSQWLMQQRQLRMRWLKGAGRLRWARRQ